MLKVDNVQYKSYQKPVYLIIKKNKKWKFDQFYWFAWYLQLHFPMFNAVMVYKLLNLNQLSSLLLLFHLQKFNQLLLNLQLLLSQQLLLNLQLLFNRQLNCLQWLKTQQSKLQLLKPQLNHSQLSNLQVLKLNLNYLLKPKIQQSKIQLFKLQLNNL